MGLQQRQKKSGISDDQLYAIAAELIADPKDGSLGGGVFKKRIAMAAGTRSGARTVVAWHQGDKVYFLDGWEKKDVPKSGSEIPDTLLRFYKLQSKIAKSYTEQQLKIAIKNRIYSELPAMKVETRHDR